MRHIRQLLSNRHAAGAAAEGFLPDLSLFHKLWPTAGADVEGCSSSDKVWCAHTHTHTCIQHTHIKHRQSEAGPGSPSSDGSLYLALSWPLILIPLAPLPPPQNTHTLSLRSCPSAGSEHSSHEHFPSCTQPDTALRLAKSSLQRRRHVGGGCQVPVGALPCLGQTECSVISRVFTDT